MIVVDSSVLIGLIRNEISPAVRRLTNDIRPRDVILGDLVLLEVLRGARDDGHAAGLLRQFESFRVEALLDRELALRAAAFHRRLRAVGVTMAKTTDLVIGTFCIERGHALLHQDRDFDPMVEHLGLTLA